MNSFTSDSAQHSAAAYVRYSSEMQNDSFSLKAQERKIRRRAKQDDMNVVSVYADPAESAYRKKYRPGIKDLLEDAKQGRFEILYVHKLDRLARRLEWTIDIVKELQEYGVVLKAVEQDFDLSTPEGKFFFHMLGSLGEFYSDNLSKETHKGKHERAAQGYHNGLLTWGYESITDENNKKVGRLIPELKPVIYDMFSKYAIGNSSDQQMADWLNQQGYRKSKGLLFTKGNLRSFLQNIYYAGKIHYRGAKRRFKGKNYRDVEGELFEGNHEAAISMDLFNRCQDARVQRQCSVKTVQKTRHIYYINGIIVCAHCERSMRAQSYRHRRYYREASREKGYADCPMEGKSVHADDIDAQIAYIIKHIKLPDNWESKVKALIAQDEITHDPEKERTRIREKLRELRKMKRYDLYEGEEHIFWKDVEKLQEKLSVLKAIKKPAVSQAAETLLDIQTAWEKATHEEQEELVKMLLQEVGCDIEHTKVAWIKPKEMFKPLFQLMDDFVQYEDGKWKLCEGSTNKENTDL